MIRKLTFQRKQTLKAYLNNWPMIDEHVFVSESSIIIGKVEINRHSSIWYNVVLRGDVAAIKIGESTNIQDGTVIHVDTEYGDTIIGDNVTVGHMCLLHACTIQDCAFIGMGSIIMDRSTIESNSMVAAGSLVVRNKVVKSGELWAGRPAKFIRNLTNEEIDGIRDSSSNYVKLSKDYMAI